MAVCSGPQNGSWHCGFPSTHSLSSTTQNVNLLRSMFSSFVGFQGTPSLNMFPHFLQGAKPQKEENLRFPTFPFPLRGPIPGFVQPHSQQNSHQQETSNCLSPLEKSEKICPVVKPISTGEITNSNFSKWQDWMFSRAKNKRKRKKQGLRKSGNLFA